MRCSNCQIQLLNNARFCHGCGEKVLGLPVNCPSCNSKNAAGSKFCTQCGCALSTNHEFKAEDYESKYPLNFEQVGSLSEQIAAHFFSSLKKRIIEEHKASEYEKYVTQFYDSGFDKRFKIRADQLAEETYTIHCKQDETVLPEIDHLLDKSFDSLLDHFIIMHCRNLNAFDIPEAILKYEGKTHTEINLEEMIFDYLDLDNESQTEKFFLDFLAVPEHKIKNAAQSFLRADKKEMVYLLCDQTVFGSCKEGFAITERGIYWKAHFNKSQAVHFEHLQDIKKENDWITINGRYFHVNAQFNFKLMKLLKRLKSIF